MTVVFLIAGDVQREFGPVGCQFCIDNLLVRIHFMFEMIWPTGLAPWEFEFCCLPTQPQGYLAHKKQPPPTRTTIGP